MQAAPRRATSQAICCSHRRVPCGRAADRPTLHVNSTRPPSLSLSGTCSLSPGQARCCTNTAAHPLGPSSAAAAQSNVRTGHPQLVLFYCQTFHSVTKRFTRASRHLICKHRRSQKGFRGEGCTPRVRIPSKFAQSVGGASCHYTHA